jgi:hypothetical protein
MADCPECGARRGNHLGGCSKMSPAQKAGAAKKSATMRAKYATNAGFRRRQSEGVLAKWREKGYQRKISKARKEQHRKGQGGQGGKEPKDKK